MVDFGGDFADYRNNADTYLNAAAYDMRVPLVLLKGLTTELTAGAYEDIDDRGKVLSRMLLTTDYLLDIVEGIGTMNMMHKKQLELPLGPVSLPHIMRKVAIDVQGFAVARNQHVMSKVSSSLPTVYAHSGSVYRVVHSLVSASLRHAHTQENGVVLITTRLDNGAVHINVSDPNSTMKVREFEHITKNFGVIDEPVRDQVNSSGLHLFIAQQLVAAMNGQISFASNKLGVRLRVTLPVTPQLTLFNLG